MSINQIIGVLIMGLLGLCLFLAAFVLIFRPSNKWVAWASATAITSLIALTVLCAVLSFRMA